MASKISLLLLNTLKYRCGCAVHARFINGTSKANKSSKDKANRSKRYSDTLNLPKTAFPLSIKDGAAYSREKMIQKMTSFRSLYDWQRQQAWDDEFVLHDGPPYANGKTHVGHVVNKVLKDITNRYKVLKRHKVHFVPGWDCHGMPIEIKAITQDTGQFQQLSPLEIREKAKTYAEKVLEEQKQSFLKWGIMGDWQSVYKTLSPEYEATQLGVFCDIYEKGFIYRDYMPVYWSPSSQTALAEAELEYNPEHVSKSVFVKFAVNTLSSKIKASLGDKAKVSAVVWTTTPWTLPFNQALCHNPSLRYAFVEDSETSEVYLCESEFVEKLKGILGRDLKSLFTMSGSSLEESTYLHPITNKLLPFVASNHVASGKGTGLVHTAPAHGHEDFNVASLHNLSKECHVDGRGTYISGVDENLLGKTIGLDADDAVLAVLGPAVIKVEDYVHSYPYDWRTKQPVIIRASLQWFINTRQLCPLALESLKDVKIRPEQSERGMVTELNSRPYWCISRQRAWGVPIPVFYNKLSGEPLVCRETVSHVQNLVQQHGSDCWWSLPLDQVLPDSLLTKIGKGKSSDYERGSDILDIWFDSGVSWASVLKDFDGVADIYIEGIDQFKGWFQTSLLTSVAAQGKAPYRNILTHGFATDEAGIKMSKSLGNVVDPEVVIHGGKNKQTSPSYGVDVLRWWVAHSHHHQNINIGPSLLKQFSEDVFKVRKCLRHTLGNLFDFNPEEELVPYSKLTAVDKYMLYNLYCAIKQMEEGYDKMSYNKVIQNVEKFVYSDLSAFYFSNIKDRCYCSDAHAQERKSSQTVQYYITRCLASAIAPIVPHLAEEVYQHLPGCDTELQDTDSVFKLGWMTPDPEWNNPQSARDLMPVFDMKRDMVDNIALESPVEFDVYIHCSPQLRALLKSLQPEATSSTSSLCELFQTSTMTVLSKQPAVINEEDFLVVRGSTLVWEDESNTAEVDYHLLLSPAQGHLCERCRRHTAHKIGTPCQRCLDAMAQDWAS